MSCGNDENDDVKPMKFYWIMGIIEMMMLNLWNLIELYKLRNVDVKPMNDENFVVKPIKFDWIVWMMKMLLLNS